MNFTELLPMNYRMHCSPGAPNDNQCMYCGRKHPTKETT